MAAPEKRWPATAPAPPAWWSGAFDLIAHDLRSPVSVIAGYARLLGQGVLDEADRGRALQGIAEAAEALGRVGQQAADLARWVDPPGDLPVHAVAVDALLARAVALTGHPEGVDLRVGDGSADARVDCLGRQALPAALAGLIDAVARHGRETAAGVEVVAEVRPGRRLCAVAVRAAGMPAPAGDADTAAALDPLRDYRELGLPGVVAATTVAAHGGWFWSGAWRRGSIGLSLPVVESSG